MGSLFCEIGAQGQLLVISRSLMVQHGPWDNRASCLHGFALSALKSGPEVWSGLVVLGPWEPTLSSPETAEEKGQI